MDADRAIGLVKRFASRFRDAGCQGLVEHELACRSRNRVFWDHGGHEDCSATTEVRHDPVGVLPGTLEPRRTAVVAARAPLI